MPSTEPPSSAPVEGHYARHGLLKELQDGLLGLGKSPGTVTIDDLSPVDEFHIGGRVATEKVLAALDLTSADHLLDVGCGLGGTARRAATRHGCRVTGLDLTRDYVEAGTALNSWVGLEHLVALHEGNALAMPFSDATFDATAMLHVGMNISDKPGLFVELARVLRSGSRLAIYDVMRIAEEAIAFPVPWSDGPGTSAVGTPAEYRDAAASAGLEIMAEHDLREFALEHFAEQARRLADSGGAPPLGLHNLMGERRTAQVRNMRANLSAGLISPRMMVLRKPL